MHCHSMQDKTGLKETIIGPGLLSNEAILVCLGVVFILSLYYGWKLKKYLPAGAFKVSSWRYNLFQIPWVKGFFKKEWAPFALGIVPAILFILVLVDGIISPTEEGMTIGPVLTWMVWWILLIFIITFAGKFFCAFCPWDFLTGIIQRFSWRRDPSKVVTAGHKWPKILANISLATFLFVVFTWMELGYGVVTNAKITAVMGGTFLGIAVIFAFTYDRRVFCRYACLVGRISGLYSLFSPVELRVNDPGICKTSCKTKDCVKGTEKSLPCPTFEVPFKLNQNTYCTLCTECVRSCDKDNLVLKARPFGSGLMNLSRVKGDEAVLTIVLLVMTLFHGLTMTKHWLNLQGFLQRIAADLSLSTSRFFIFTVGMILCLIIPAIVYICFSWGLSRLLRKQKGARELAIQFAFIFLPLSLFYHLAHNGMHFFSEVSTLVPVLSDPFARGWDLFGTASYIPSFVISPASTVVIQLVILGTGFLFAMKTLASLVVKHFASGRAAVVFSYYTLGLWFVFGICLFLIHQPMVMRLS